MSYSTAHISTNPLQNIDKRILIAVIGFVVAAVVGVVSVVSAQTTDKPTKQWCAEQGYTNYGQCVSSWAQNKGYGYGDS